MRTTREPNMKTHRALILTITSAFLVLASSGSCALVNSLKETQTVIPTARVTRGPMDLKVFTTGELRPARTSMIVAPSVSGTLQIVQIARTGTRVDEGDVVVAFDPTEQEYNLEQSQSQLDEADQQIKKMKADQAVRTSQDSVSLLRAQFDVRRAELMAKGNDLLSGIDAKKNLLNLEEAKRRLEQLQRDIKSKASSDIADLAVLGVARARALMGMKMAQQNIENMTIKAPASGVVVLGQNIDSLMSAGGGIMISSAMDIPEYRQGDQAYAGRTIGQILDIGQMEILSKVGETDRGSLSSGQPIDVRVDSLPLRNFGGKIKSLGGSASSSSSMYFDPTSARSFDAIFELDLNGEQINPGITAQVVIRGMNVADALSLPRQALFQKEGKPVVYVKNLDNWEARPVQVKYVTESRAVIDGLAEGSEVALVDPGQEKNKAAASPAAAPIVGGAVR